MRKTDSSFLESRLVTAGFLFTLVCASFVASYFIPPSAWVPDLDHVLAPPSSLHFLGTDSLGRDLCWRLFGAFGGSITVSLLASSLALVIGIFYGALAAWAGAGAWPLMRLLELFNLLPSLLWMGLILAWVQLTFPGLSWFGLCLALALGGWMNLARLTRIQLIQLSQSRFVESMRAQGASPLRSISFHLWPHLRSGLSPGVLALLSQVVLFESLLSFLGLGFQGGMLSLGTLIREAWEVFPVAPAQLLYPGVALAAILLLLQRLLLGDEVKFL